MPTLESYLGVYLWNYVPNLPAAIAFASLFSLATAAHAWKMVVTKSWFCAAFTVGGFCASLPAPRILLFSKLFADMVALFQVK